MFLGDKVLIRPKLDSTYSALSEDMQRYIGMYASVVSIEGDASETQHVKLDVDRGFNVWTEDMLLPVISLEQFWNKEVRKAIHCSTGEKAKQLCNKFHLMGKRWSDDDSYAVTTAWHIYKSNSCYVNNGRVRSIDQLPATTAIYTYEQIEDLI